MHVCRLPGSVYQFLFVGASRPLLDATALISFALPICPHLDAFFGVALCPLPHLRPYPISAALSHLGLPVSRKRSNLNLEILGTEVDTITMQARLSAAPTV